MDTFSFDKLLEVNIKRLSRPKFRHEFPQFNDPTLYQTQLDPKNDYSDNDELSDEQKLKLWKEQGAFTNDVSYDGISSDTALSYFSNFGKIFKGEQFKTLLTILNTSSIYTLDRIRINVSVSRNSKSDQLEKGDLVLIDETINSLGARQ